MSRLHRFDSTDSTNERALEAFAAGDGEDGDLFVAREQRAGRGRRGREWESAPGEGLYVSRLFLPTPPAPPPPAVTMAAGLAVLDATTELGLADARLDWPNDVVVRDAKLAGILVESRGFDPTRPHFVIGVGVNVLQRMFSSALEEERRVTSLVREGVAAAPDEVLDRFAPALTRRLEQPLPTLCDDYLHATGLSGKRVRVEHRAEELEGTLQAIDLTRGVAIDVEGERQWLSLAHVRGLQRVH